MATLTDAQVLVQAAHLIERDDAGVTGSTAIRTVLSEQFRQAVHNPMVGTLTLVAAREVIEKLKPPIDTLNQFMVGRRGDVVTIGLPAKEMSPDDALTFAAWLVMCAGEGEMDRFDEILEAIRNT